MTLSGQSDIRNFALCRLLGLCWSCCCDSTFYIALFIGLVAEFWCLVFQGLKSEKV